MTFTLILDKEFSQYSSDLEFEFDLAQAVESGRSRSLTTISNQDPQAARHFAFQPGQNNPRIEFILYNNGEDKSNGTLSASNISDSNFSNDTVVTIEEQIRWLNYYIEDNRSDPRWLLTGGQFTDINGDGINEGANVVVEKVNVTNIAGATTARGNIQLKFGVTI